MVVTRGTSDFSEESSASANVKKRRDALRNKVWAFALMERSYRQREQQMACLVGLRGRMDGSPRNWGWGVDQGR